MSNRIENWPTRPHLWLIRVIGVIVPRRLRADWRQEWEAELRYREMLLAEWDKLDSRHKLDLLRRCLGAFWDALLLQPRRWEDEMFQDLRYGARLLRMHPGFTSVAVLTLSIGIGANTAIFSIIQAVLLRPLPFAQPERVVMVERAGLLLDRHPASPIGFLKLKEQHQVLEQVAAYAQGSVNLAEGGEPERILTMAVTASFFPTVGIAPVFGRAFSREEEQASKNRVAVLSHGLWERRFGADPRVLGQILRLNGQRFTVIGIMPPDFQFPQFPAKTEIWIPLTYLDTVLSSEAMDYFEIIGRLKSGVTIAQAQARMDNILSQMQPASLSSRTREKIQLVPIAEKFVSGLRSTLLMLLGAVGFVLLIACANVANLLLARAASRQKEIVVRGALGASRFRLVRQWLTESLLLALLGGSGGLLLAFGSTRALLAISPVYIPRANEIRIDGWVLGFTLIVSLVTALVFGLAPALRFSRPDLSQALKEGAPGAITGQPLIRRVLVTAEVALSLILLIGAGLLIQSFVRVHGNEPGFNPAQLLTLNIWLPRATYAEPQRRAAFYEQVDERIKAIPGVQFVGATNTLPLAQAAQFFIPFTIEGRTANEVLSGRYRTATPDYFRAMEIPLQRGRSFTAQDNAQAPPVVIINAALARREFPNQDPIGQRLKIGNFATAYEIVGVVGDVSHVSLEQAAEPEFYLSNAQRPMSYLSLVVRTGGNPRDLISAVRQAIWAVDKEQPVYNLKPMEQVLADSLSQRRFSMLLLGVFAAAALLLTAVGIYGVMSYAVAERTHELGVRLALGAQTADVLKLVVGQGLTPVLIGVGIGLLAALALTRVLSSLLFNVSATDPLSFAVIAALLLVVALLACYFPARKAAQIDPMMALRRG